MSVYRCLFSDTFLNVQAESEAQAVERAAAMLKERIRPDDFISWQDDSLTPDQPSAFYVGGGKTERAAPEIIGWCSGCRDAVYRDAPPHVCSITVPTTEVKP